MPGQFIISLDFELLWGMRDHVDKSNYGVNILGARRAIPKILNLFESRGIQATWATVGFLFCESKDELIHCLPSERPRYDNPRLSNYNYISEVGPNERLDPYYFAASLVSQISETPGQEIASHTLSHFYCLDNRSPISSFEADIRAAQQLAARRDIELRSIVFPRNQYDSRHVDLCCRVGISRYRGNPKGWVYRPTHGKGQSGLRRAVRLADAYTGILGPHEFCLARDTKRNVPASQFLRPCGGFLSMFHRVHVETIIRGMTAAARTNSGYHLWWHPHNFGEKLGESLQGLQIILDHFNRLEDRFGMVSSTMADAE